MKDLIIVGAGGFGREVVWLVERINQSQPTWKVLGFVDDAAFQKLTDVAYWGTSTGYFDTTNHHMWYVQLEIVKRERRYTTD